MQDSNGGPWKATVAAPGCPMSFRCEFPTLDYGAFVLEVASTHHPFAKLPSRNAVGIVALRVHGSIAIVFRLAGRAFIAAPYVRVEVDQLSISIRTT